MKKRVFTYLLIPIILVLTTSAFSLESLSRDQMKQAVGRAGIDIAITNAVTETYFEHITFSSPDIEPITHYMRFNGLHMVTTLNTGGTDVGGDGMLNHFSLDVGLYAPTNQVMLFAKSPDLSIVNDITVDSIDFCEKNIGGLTVDDFKLSSFHLIAGPHDECGVDFELGMRTRVESLVWQYGENQAIGDDLALKLTGICFAESFDENNNYAAEGEFQVGDLAHGKPATFDVGSDGTRAFVAVNLPLQGSVRIDNITMGGTDFGAFTLDGIEAEKLYIEIPGRGLGKP